MCRSSRGRAEEYQGDDIRKGLTIISEEDTKENITTVFNRKKMWNRISDQKANSGCWIFFFSLFPFHFKMSQGINVFIMCCGGKSCFDAMEKVKFQVSFRFLH